MLTVPRFVLNPTRSNVLINGEVLVQLHEIRSGAIIELAVETDWRIVPINDVHGFVGRSFIGSSWVIVMVVHDIVLVDRDAG